MDAVVTVRTIGHNETEVIHSLPVPECLLDSTSGDVSVVVIVFDEMLSEKPKSQRSSRSRRNPASESR